MHDLKEQLITLQTQVNDIARKLAFDKKRARVKELEAASTAPDFWDHEEQAREMMQELSDLKADVTAIDAITESIRSQLDLIELAETEEEQAEIAADVQQALKQIQKEVAELETKLFLSGEHDEANAIVSIHAGQGGTEAMDWAQMLLRMYLRYFERKGWKVEMLDESQGEEAGIKSASMLVKARYAYGYLKGEYGTHRLVRQSPFNADNLRQTSFAMVEVLPELSKVGSIELSEDELEWEFFRSSGKGGQNVNKVSTAVRLTHTPTRITVECQAERTQVQNRKMAESLLKSRLWERQQKKRQETKEELKGDTRQASWGTQIRNYVLHPYQLVKDVRTEVETSNTEAVLDGDLDDFIEAELRLVE